MHNKTAYNSLTEVWNQGFYSKLVNIYVLYSEIEWLPK